MGVWFTEHTLPSVGKEAGSSGITLHPMMASSPCQWFSHFAVLSVLGWALQAMPFFRCYMLSRHLLLVMGYLLLCPNLFYLFQVAEMFFERSHKGKRVAEELGVILQLAAGIAVPSLTCLYHISEVKAQK